MASEKSLQDSFSDHSPRRHREDTTSSSSISSNDTKNTTKSNKCRRNSACTEYSEDFEDNSSIVESFKEGSVKSEHQAIKKESTTKNNNQSNQKRAQTKPTIKMLQHLNQSTVVKNKSQNRGGQDFDPVTRHILSARLHKTKELKNEVCDLQRELENARLENRLLRQLQYRHMKALVRFENEQNNLPQLLVRHEGEVQMLKEMLRKSKDQDRNVSKQLKEAESELWKTKNSLQKLKVLCDKKNLGERDELNWQLTNLTKKLELDQQKIQDLEKILELKGKSFNHQLATEHRKTHEALDLIKKLELEQRTLNQMLTEKERQLGVKNIYANRVLLNHSKNMSSPRHKAENVAKAIQTEDCFSPISSFSPHNVLPNLEKKAVHCEKETSSEADDEDSKASKSQLRKEDGEMDSEVERLRKEYEQAEKRWKEMAENDILENLEREKREKQEKERADQFLREALERKETGEEEQDAKEREQQKTTEENRDASESRQDGNKEIGEAFALNDSPNKTPSRLRRRYRFTEQIENLHQGLPVCKISYAAHMSNKKRQDRQEDEFLDFNSSFNGYEPSFAKLCNRSTELMHQVGDGPSEKPKNCLQSTSRNDTKNSLMEKLFRSASTLENKPAKDDEVKAIDSLKQLQRNKQASRIQVTNKGRLNVLDPELLPVRVLESSADESEKLVLQSLNK
ncbi:lebercilin-like protein isoform X1 [Scyliorhinus canicula]|uniref:lebercilin-like protein isoform X1 n=1 Tax=Scyliorhinus canicula TaxID=7830 RepID=UPI0018F7605C|nr:lebercilin-like protein isoform X1 [Scyliorhinus canicula]